MKGIALICIVGLVGLALSAATYLAASALWSAVSFAEAVWMAPATAPAALKIIWVVTIFASLVAWRVRDRLPPSGIVAIVAVLVAVAAASIAVREVISRASVDGWPAFGSETWRYFLAPLYAEHALTAFLAFIGVTSVSLPRRARSPRGPPKVA